MTHITTLNAMPNTLGEFQNTMSTPRIDRIQENRYSRKTPTVAPITTIWNFLVTFTTPNT